MKIRFLCLFTLLSPAFLASADTLFLPNPVGSTVLAGWVPTNAEVVDGELDYDGPWVSTWTSSTVLQPSWSAGNADWGLTSTFTGTNFMGTNSIYTMNTAPVSFSISAENYTGSAFGKVILQLTPNADAGRADQFALNASLTIGGTTYTASQATYSALISPAFGGDFNDPENRYYGHFGSLALVTYEWDLGALGFSGDTSSFSLSWDFPQPHTTIYDAQVSVAPVPEPATFWIAGGLLSLVVCRAWNRRRGMSSSCRA